MFQYKDTVFLQILLCIYKVLYATHPTQTQSIIINVLTKILFPFSHAKILPQIVGKVHLTFYSYIWLIVFVRLGPIQKLATTLLIHMAHRCNYIF